METSLTIALFCVDIFLCCSQETMIDSLLDNRMYIEAGEIILKDCSHTKDSNIINLKLGNHYTSKKQVDSAFFYLMKVDTSTLRSLDKARYLKSFGELHYLQWTRL